MFYNYSIRVLKSVYPKFHWLRQLAILVANWIATKKVQWPILNNSHAYPFCKTMRNGQYSISVSETGAKWSQFGTVSETWGLTLKAASLVV